MVNSRFLSKKGVIMQQHEFKLHFQETPWSIPDLSFVEELQWTSRELHPFIYSSINFLSTDNDFLKILKLNP